MSGVTLRVQVVHGRRTIQFDRAAQRNSFNSQLFAELDAALDDAEQDSACRMIVLEGRDGYFSTGLDLQAGLEQAGPDDAAPYMSTLRRLALFPAFVVANVDGQARAGGLGFVACSDLAIATPRSTFALPEALWGLVPACVGLHLCRRIGVQATKRLCLTTESLSAAQALGLGLVDEVVERPDETLRKLGLKVTRLKRETIGRIKRYFSEVAGIAATAEARAMQETDLGMSDPEVREAIVNFVRHGRFPWEAAGANRAGEG